MIKRLAILVAGMAFAQDGQVRVIQNSRAGRTRNLTLVGSLDRPAITDKALSLLGTSDVTMGRLLIYPSEEIGQMATRENQESCTPQSLKSFLSLIGMRTDPVRCPEISEAIKIGSNIALRTVDSACRNKTSLLQGSANPFLIRSLSQQHELLSMSVGIASKSKESWGAEYPRVSLFVRTQAKPSMELAKDILAQAREMSAARDVIVVVRNDSKFAKYCEFPQPYLFGGLASIATGDDAPSSSSPEVTCVALFPHPTQCWSRPAKAW